MMIRAEIRKLIEKSLKEWQKKGGFELKFKDILIERPEKDSYGDYSTNVAFVLARQAKKNPLEIAKEIVLAIKNQKSNLLEKVDVADPGFINFSISKNFLQKQVATTIKIKDQFGQLKIGRGKKIQVEFVSANPTGPLTVGNARGGPYGDTLANVFKKAGYKTEKEYYVNDYGMQINVLGHSILKDSEAAYKGEYIDRLSKRIKEKDPFKAGRKGAKIIIDEMIKKTVLKMGIRYDVWFLESSLHLSKEVDKALKLLEKKRLTYEKEGAIWFKSTVFGDNRDRVLVKSDGGKTYLAGDIAYHSYKFNKKKFDKVINIWGADHHGDVMGLKAGVAAIGYEGKLEILLHQFVTVLDSGEKLRMSKRKGVYVSMDELIEIVGRDAVRFFFLQKSNDTHLNFDLSLAKEQSEKNPVFYVQYAHARICSILRKAKEQKVIVKGNSGLKMLKDPGELKLIKKILLFPEIVEDCAKDYQVHRLPQYSMELAATFNQFYRDCKVLSEDRLLSQARLQLIIAAKITLKNTMDLMGVSSPEKM